MLIQGAYYSFLTTMPPKRAGSTATATKQNGRASGLGGAGDVAAVRKKARRGGGTIATPGKKTSNNPETVQVTPTEEKGNENEKVVPSVSFEYLKKDLPLQELTDKLLVNKVRVCVDTKFYPFDKYYSRSKYMSGLVQVAFLDMGWGANNWEYAHKRATGMNAVIDVMADRVSDNREKSKLRCKKKFESKCKSCVAGSYSSIGGYTNFCYIYEHTPRLVPRSH